MTDFLALDEAIEILEELQVGVSSTAAWSILHNAMMHLANTFEWNHLEAK